MTCPACNKETTKPPALVWHKCEHCGCLMQNGIRKTVEDKKRYHEAEKEIRLDKIAKKIEQLIIEQHIHAEPEALEKYKKIIPEINYYLHNQKVKTDLLLDALKTVRIMLIEQDKCLDIADIILKIMRNLDDPRT